jgi:hypothetical protein
LLAGAGRFIDKTPRNALRLPYLEALFPDAMYLFIYRDGRSIVGSLYREWTKKREKRPPYLLPPGFAVGGLPERIWWFVLPPGWRRFNGRPLEEVCAFQYVSCLEAMLTFRESVESNRLVEVNYEDLCQNPTFELRRIFEALNLVVDENLIDRASEKIRPLSPTEGLAPEVTRVLPQIQSLLDRTGYGAGTRSSRVNPGGSA